jgi:flagellar motor switch protein FliG
MKGTESVPRNPKDPIAFENLTGPEKATLVLLSLSEDTSAEILKKLDQREIQMLTNCAATLPRVQESILNGVLEEFITRMESGKPVLAFDSKEKIRSILQKFLPKDQIEDFMEAVIFGDEMAQSFDSIQNIDPQTLATFVANEHPQTIALLLAYLDVGKAAQVLPLLPKDMQTDVVMRIAAIDRVAPQVVKNLKEVFVHEIVQAGSVRGRQVGGTQAVAALMNTMDTGTVQAVFGELEAIDPQFCEQIRNLMFVFDDLSKLDDRSLQSIIKEITNDTITMALKTASDEMKEKIFKNISSRAAEMIREELEVMGPVKLSDVEKAQQEIVAIARRLEEEGKIVLAGKASAEAYV